ncbi:MAG: 30S ribosomal protein S12 methylthiotransferase RimO [Gemmataceae bacterium]
MAQTLPAEGARLAFVSLGCPKNTVDSERMLGKLVMAGHQIVSDAADADVVVVNTCGFIEPARQESLGVLRDLVKLKEDGQLRAVVAAGCLAERDKGSLFDQVPGLDQVVGVHGREEIATAVGLSLDRVLAAGRKRKRVELADEQRTLFRPAPVKAQDDTARLRATPRHYAYLKISEGCDRLCTFCAIPQMRGKHVSKPVEEILREARELAADGVRELMVVAQDTTWYGLDLYGEPSLARLLRELRDVEGIDWIRLHYLYPAHVTDDLVRVRGEGGRILPSIDMPLQHTNDRVLKRMNRKTTRAATDEILGRLRAGIPGLVMRSTFLVGFPGETEAEFEELCDWVADAGIERLGVFPYSHEETTPSSRLEGQLPEEVKTSRRDRLMEVQQAVAFRHAAAQVGKRIPVIVDGPDPEMPGWVLARSVADAPEIDPVVRIKAPGRSKTAARLDPGEILQVEVTGADGYDLVAKPAKGSA